MSNNENTGWRDYYNTKAKKLDEHAATYGSTVPLARHFYRTRRNVVIELLREGSGLVGCDVGCGSGEYLPALLDVVSGPVIAVDIAFGYLKQSMAREPRACGIQATATALPLPKHSVDVLLATEVIEHLVDPLALLDEVRRVLSPQGLLILSTPNPLSLHDLLYRVKRRARGYKVNEHPGLVMPWTLRRELRQRGFTIVRHVTTNFAYPYPIGEFLGRLPNQRAILRFTEQLETKLNEMRVMRWLGWTHVLLAVPATVGATR